MSDRPKRLVTVQQEAVCEKVVYIRKFATGYGWTARDVQRNCIFAVLTGHKVPDPFEEWMSLEMYSIWDQDVLGPIGRLDNRIGSISDVEALQLFSEKISVRVDVEPESKLFP